MDRKSCAELTDPRKAAAATKIQAHARRRAGASKSQNIRREKAATKIQASVRRRHAVSASAVEANTLDEDSDTEADTEDELDDDEEEGHESVEDLRARLADAGFTDAEIDQMQWEMENNSDEEMEQVISPTTLCLCSDRTTAGETQNRSC